MRKSLRIFIFFLIAAAAAVAGVSPRQWTAIKDYAARHIATELATVEKLKTGKIKLGPAPVPASKLLKQPVDKSDKVKRKPEMIQADLPPATTVNSPHAAPATTVSSPPAPPATEEAFSGLIKHQDRGPPPGPDPFWTEQRMREAIEHGEPQSKSRMCLFGCKKSE